ncbi:MAG TPA: hypothetical protein VLL54_07690 [Pyrinomonadaceae bacterium]|nr:hypothetical protein [Pyrinomonadaceae bacterium]
MHSRQWKSRNRTDLIIEVWEFLDCESVGARELEAIQTALDEEFGAGGVMSPATIARVVADEGAVLRHPEVFDCDVKWRQANLRQGVFRDELDFSELSAAFESVVKIEQQRMQLDKSNSQLKELREIVQAARDETRMKSHSKIIDAEAREQFREIAHWLTVWLQAPELFSDWLDLRRRSPEFVKKFG